MKVKIQVSYEWEEDLTEAWEEWKSDGYTIEEFKQQELCCQHAIERLDCAADNHILNNYERSLKVEWENE